MRPSPRVQLQLAVIMWLRHSCCLKQQAQEQHCALPTTTRMEKLRLYPFAFDVHLSSFEQGVLC